MFKILLITVFFMVSVSHASQISVTGNASSYLREKVATALNMLPANYLDSAHGHIEIEEVEMKDFLSEDLCHLDEQANLGTTFRTRKGHRIQISSFLIDLARRVKHEQKCSHGTFEKVLIATILHELTHVKDNFEKISLDADFQRIVGMKRITKNSRKGLMNQNIGASPDPYEFVNLEEALAVNVEYFLLDKDYECRKPATANFLSKKLGIPLNGVCLKNSMVLIQSAYLEDNYGQSVSIDPSRIYQIHYLHAGKGQAIFSRWGHSMFRLVVCAPHRKFLGPDCLKDVSHHLALSYRAYITDMNISYGKGMRGKYPSQLFVMKFLEVQQEYTKFELRDLYSVPLKLTLSQKRDFLDITLERFWTYQGKYYFLDNNCATEAQKHLAVALTDEQSALIRSLTPSRILKDITKMKNGLMEDKVELIKGQFDELNKTYQLLRSWGLYKSKSFKKFLKKTKSSLRLKVYESFFGNSKLDAKEKKIILMRLIFLERYLLTRFAVTLPKKAVKKMNKDKDLKELVMKMGDGLKLLTVQPWDVVVGRYGVPLAHEFENQVPLFMEKRELAVKKSLGDQLANMQGLLNEDHFSEELEEIENFKRIKKYTTDILRSTL